MKTKKYYLISTILIMMFLFSSRFLNSQNIDNTYRVIEKIGKVEIREYEPSLFASYENDQMVNNQNSSFRVLADYIFGANDNDEKIAMTSPVVIKLHNNREMLFRMPKKYNKKSLPQPENNDIKIILSKKVIKATIQYSGYTNEQKELKMVNQLKNILSEYNIKHNEKFELLVYDPPYKIMNRRNEISVNIID